MGGSESKPSSNFNNDQQLLIEQAKNIISNYKDLRKKKKKIMDIDDYDNLNKYLVENDFENLNNIIDRIANESYEKLGGQKGLRFIYFNKSQLDNKIPDKYPNKSSTYDASNKMLMGGKKKMYMGNNGGIFYFNKYGNRVYVK